MARIAKPPGALLPANLVPANLLLAALLVAALALPAAAAPQEDDGPAWSERAGPDHARDLPPPRVIGGPSGERARPALPPATETPPPPPSTPARTTMPPPSTPTPPGGGGFPAPRGGVLPRGPGTGAPLGPPTRSTIIRIDKHHDQPWGDDQLALRIDVTFSVVGCQGAPIGLAAWFADLRTGILAPSLRSDFRDPRGYLFTRSEVFRPTEPAGRYTGSLLIPYCAFPPPRAGDRYEVEARIQVLRWQPGTAAPVVAEGMTTFTVHSAPLATARTDEGDLAPLLPSPEAPEGGEELDADAGEPGPEVERGELDSDAGEPGPDVERGVLDGDAGEPGPEVEMEG